MLLLPCTSSSRGNTFHGLPSLLVGYHLRTNKIKAGGFSTADSDYVVG